MRVPIPNPCSSDALLRYRQPPDTRTGCTVTSDPALHQGQLLGPDRGVTLTYRRELTEAYFCRNVLPSAVSGVMVSAVPGPSLAATG